jgi:hypothetical protein
VYNNCANDEEENKTNEPSKHSSLDSLKKSFHDTELSSDDEKAEIQVEESRKKKLAEQSEL